MAGITIDHKIKASSLFETIVALMVIMIVFGIAMTIYVNVVRNSNSLAEFKAAQKLEEIALDTKEKKSYFDESFQEGEIMIEKTLSKYQDKNELWLLELKATDPANKIIASRKEILITDTDE